jgi:putative flippase GtrA
MMLSTGPLLARLKAEHGAKALRYCGVSAVNVLTGVSTMAFFHGVLHWSGVSSNLMAWSVSTAPAYLLSRAWVWQQSGSHRLSGEVVPFWVMALAGLLLSTFVVNLVDQRTDRTSLVLVALLAAYGVVWVAKYVILDKVMWQRPTVVDPVEIG